MTDPKELMVEAKARAADLHQFTLIAKARKADGVNAREEVFCREYVTGLDVIKAIQATGYSGNNPREVGVRWLQRPQVKARIAALQKRDEVRAEMSREIYLKMLQDTYEKAMSDGDYSGANKAAELMGKALGYFVEQKAVLNVSAKMPENQAQEVEEVKRLARIAGVNLE